MPEKISSTNGQVATIEIDEFAQYIETIVFGLPDMVWSVDLLSHEFLYVSPAVVNLFGRTEQEIYEGAISFSDLIHPDNIERVQAEWNSALHGGLFESEYEILMPSGERRWIHSHGRVATAKNGSIARMYGVSRNVTERHDQQQKIAQINRLHTILSRINSAIVRIRKRSELFQEVCRILVEQGGFGMVLIGMIDQEGGGIRSIVQHGFQNEVVGDEIVPPFIQGSSTPNMVSHAVNEKKPIFVDELALSPSDHRFRKLAIQQGYRSGIALPFLIQGTCVGVMLIYAKESSFFNGNEFDLMAELAADISFALEHIAKDEQLSYAKQYDALTGLPNRNLFIERLGGLLASASREDTKIAVVAGDIKRFHLINDAFGRDCGDILLKDLAQRMTVAWPHPENLSRLSSDCFAVALKDVQNADYASYLIEKAIVVIQKKPFFIDNKEISISFPLGVAIFPDDGESADTLLRYAEYAEKKAKAESEQLLFYRPSLIQQVEESILLETRLRKAIEASQFVLHYQPKINASNGTVAGFEALIRWQSPEYGLVPPADFIPLLEETALILDIGPWVMSAALADGQHWRLANGTVPRIAVNVSPLQLQQRDFVLVMRRVMEECIHRGCQLDLEITESLIMSDIDANMKKLAAIREMGVQIAIDDFGTGYSSLGYLAKLPVHALKIDQSFVNTMTTDVRNRTIVETVISLAHAVGLKVIAEGVESQEQAKLLRRLKCDQLQGYLYSRPLPAYAVNPFLLRSR